MFWKSATSEEQPQPRGAYSITRRLMVFNILAAVIILLTTVGYLYYGLVLSLEQEDRLYLTKKIEVVRSVLREHPHDSAAVQREIELQGDVQFTRFFIRVLDAKGMFLCRPAMRFLLQPSMHFPIRLLPICCRNKGKKCSSVTARQVTS